MANEELKAILLRLAELKCSDGYCHLGGSASGQHTNGGCRCLEGIRNPNVKVRVAKVLSEARKIVSL